MPEYLPAPMTWHPSIKESDAMNMIGILSSALTTIHTGKISKITMAEVIDPTIPTTTVVIWNRVIARAHAPFVGKPYIYIWHGWHNNGRYVMGPALQEFINIWNFEEMTTRINYEKFGDQTGGLE